jgi:large subunit ribosomal protein L49
MDIASPQASNSNALPETLEPPQKSAPAFKNKHQHQTVKPPVAPPSAPKTHASTSTPVNQDPEPSTRTSPSRPYHVARIVPSRRLPIYTDRKGHGTLKQTVIRKITGDPIALASELKEHLGIVEKKDCKVNPTNGQVVVKGHWTKEVTEWLTAKGF